MRVQAATCSAFALTSARQLDDLADFGMAHGIVRPLSFVLRGNEAAPPQARDMVGDVALRNPKLLSDFLDRERPAHEQLHDAKTRRIPQRAKVFRRELGRDIECFSRL